MPDMPAVPRRVPPILINLVRGLGPGEGPARSSTSFTVSDVIGHGMTEQLDIDAVGAAARRAIGRMAQLDRASCSPGELEAARLIATALRERGATVYLQHCRRHGTYWWPLGLTSLAGVLAAATARRRRIPAVVAAAIAAGAVIDDLGAKRRWLRRLLPKQPTANVVAITGDRRATRTLVLVAHHDAAHSGTFFDPRLAALAARRRGVGDGQVGQLPGVMAPIPAGPALVAVGALTRSRPLIRLGAGICAGIVCSVVDIALRPTVAGANDNLTGVAALLGVARSLADDPVRDLRVMLVSTGAEEALMVGMQAFVADHLAQLRRGSAQVLCVDTLGSPHLVLPEAEGMLRARSHDAHLNQVIQGCADEAGIAIRRGVVMRMGTDAYIALRHGIPAALLMSLDDHGVPSNYHWPTDTPDRVDFDTVVDAIVLCDRVVRRLAGAASSSISDTGRGRA
jgi:hypothetical protein